MKSLRFMLPAVLMLFSAAAFAQSEAQKSFDVLKSLAGSWEGRVSTDPPVAEMGNNAHLQLTLRITSRGNALVHEMKEAGSTDDPARYDHPVTMLYLDNDRLTLIHYCDAGNRPRMIARPIVNGKTVEFDLVDVSGSTAQGNMQHAVFTVIDANHHTEDWTYLMPGNKPLHAHFDAQRTNSTTAAAK